jgi:hypothetical protein
MLRRVPFVFLAAGLLATGGAVSAQDKADVRVVKYAGLGQEVLNLRGKVVLVDFWHTT